ncbi:hypothetical protein D3C85_880020 [compost metagenome]
MLPGFHQGADDQTAKQDTRKHHQQKRQTDRPGDSHHGQVEVGFGLFDRGLLLIGDVLVELADRLDEGGTARRAVFVVHHIERRIVFAAQGFDHGVHAIVDIGAIAAHQVHGKLAAGVVLQHVLLEVGETAAHASQQVRRTLERRGGVASGILATAPARFLQVTRGHHQAHARAQHVAIDDLDLLGAFGQGIDLAYRLIIALQEVGSQASNRRDQQRKERHDPQQHRADAGIAQPQLAFDLGCARGFFLAGLAGL